MALLALAISCSRSDRSDASGALATTGASAATSSVVTAAPPKATSVKEPATAPPNGTAPEGFVKVRVGGVAPTAQGNAVLLVDEGDVRAVPIFVGESEALSIRLRLERRRYIRPLTHDLLDDMLEELGGRIDSVRVEKLENDVFYGIVVVRDGPRRIELDARSSDAVALALGSGAPIFVARRVLERAGVDLDDVKREAPAHAEPSSDKDGRNPVSL